MDESDPLNFSKLESMQMPELYRTDTGPLAHRLTAAELAAYERTPPSLVGKTFVPGNGELLWEIIEVTFSKAGWSAITLREEGSERSHRMTWEDFVALLKNGTVQGTDE